MHFPNAIVSNRNRTALTYKRFFRKCTCSYTCNTLFPELGNFRIDELYSFYSYIYNAPKSYVAYDYQIIGTR